MPTLHRRRLLMTSAAGGIVAAVRPMVAQNKPDKLVYIGDNQGGWKRTLTERLVPPSKRRPGSKWNSPCFRPTPGRRG